MSIQLVDNRDSAGNLFAPAITTTHINSRTGNVPAGTEFMVMTHYRRDHKDHRCDGSHGYRNCQGLSVSSIWLDEFRLVERDEPVYKVTNPRPDYTRK